MIVHDGHYPEDEIHNMEYYPTDDCTRMNDHMADRLNFCGDMLRIKVAMVYNIYNQMKTEVK